MRVALAILATLMLVAGPTLARADAPLAEKFLLEGKLADGAAALKKRLTTNPTDDQARFGLGTVQFLQTFEHLGQSLYKYGLRTERSFVRPAPQIRQLLPQNPNPEKIDYAAARQILQTFVDDVNRAEATLADVKDPNVKLPLHMALIKLDPFGLGTPVNAAFLFQQFDGNIPGGDPEQLAQFVIAFDRGDVSWLRGYCHFLAAWGEVLLAVDGKPLSDCTAHWVFENAVTPHTFLIEDRESFNPEQPIWNWNRRWFADWFAGIHLILRLPMKEPERMKVAHGHLESMCRMSREMWTHYKTETDDDNEWIPNPQQTGVVGIPVTDEMVATWLATVEEAELVLQGKRLVPFWRGTQWDRGINLKRVFYEPTDIDIPLWIQGTAATPYLERGPLTKFTNPDMLRRIDRQFGGLNFIGFGFWFN